MTTKRAILSKLQKQITRPGAVIDLHRAKGEGYWYFSYEADGLSGTLIYDTESVYVMRLNDMSIEAWVAYGSDLIARMEKH